MKKLIALIAVFATVLSFSACKLNKDLTPEEKQSKYVAERSEKEAASIQAENDYIDGVHDYSENEIGKTQKGKKLVVKCDSPLGYKYNVFEFNKKGKMTARLCYEFYDSIENFEVQSNIKDARKYKIVDTDKEARMVVIKYNEVWEQSFDEIYNTYAKPEIQDLGYTIVE